MSCRKEHSLQLTHLFIKALFLIIIFSSCAKEEFYLPENPQPIPDKNPIIEVGEPYYFSEKNKQEPPYATELQNVKYVLTMEKHIRHLTLNTMFATYFYPQLRGLTGSPIADTRTGFPCSSLSTDSNGNHTLVLNYNSCTTVSGATYDGVITVFIDGELDVAGTTVTITLSNGFIVDDGSLDGSISMTYESGTERYNIDDLCLSNTVNGTDETKVATSPGGFGGQIGVEEVNTNTDPTGLIDDNFTYEAAILEVTCPDPGTGAEPVKLTATINSIIHFNILCGVPQDGEVALELEAMPYATIDFAHPNILGSGECNNKVAVYLESNPDNEPEIITIE